MTNRSTSSSESTDVLIDPTMLAQHQHYDDDEIDFVALWLSLEKQRKVFLLIAIIITGLGLAFALSKPLHYEYSTLIEIGSNAAKTDSNASPLPIQPVSAVKSELQIAFINQALREYYLDTDITRLIKIKVSSPKDTNLLILSSEGRLDNEAAHLKIQNRIVTLLIEKHSAITDAIREDIRAEQLSTTYSLEDLEDDKLFAAKSLASKSTLKQKQDQLTKLKEEKLNLDKQLARLDSLHELLNSQYQSAVDNLKIALQNQRLASRGKPDTALLILLTSELQEYRTNIAALEERLNIKLPEQIAKVKQEISDNFRNQENQTTEIQLADYDLTKLEIDRDREIVQLKAMTVKLSHDLSAVATTHSVLPPARSLEPKPRKRSLILAVSIMLALFAGLFAAMIAAFLSSVKERKESEET